MTAAHFRKVKAIISVFWDEKPTLENVGDFLKRFSFGFGV